ncbi:site-specific integrase [Ferroplasma sp.]|uniref:tyrosine-type recombinase/integrase n=1 Tax=Ferroplasma sp. TaxID=2591003 RepID=UPI002618A6C2|nr:site-specific integrase [Ferroplasma sp.]
MPVNFNKNLSIQSARNNVSISYFRGQELDQIFDYIKNKILNNRNHEALYRKYYFLMKVLLYTGARIEEIVPYHRDEYLDKKGIHEEISSPGLRPVDINLDVSTVTLPTLKKKTLNGRLPQRVLPISQDFKNEYISYAMAMHIDIKSKEPLFPITRKAVNKFMGKLQDELGFKIHPHKFRHTFGVTAVLSGIPLNVLQEWLAHSSIFITSIYTQITGLDTSRYMGQMDYQNL